MCSQKKFRCLGTYQMHTCIHILYMSLGEESHKSTFFENLKMRASSKISKLVHRQAQKLGQNACRYMNKCICISVAENVCVYVCTNIRTHWSICQSITLFVAQRWWKLIAGKCNKNAYIYIHMYIQVCRYIVLYASKKTYNGVATDQLQRV